MALRYCSSCNRQFIGRGKVNSGGQLFCCGHCSGGRGHSQKCQSRLSAIANGEETFHAREEVSHRSRSPRRHFSADSSPRCHSGRSSIQNTPLCSICLSNTPTFECMPCHHCCICSNCRDGFNPVNCPMCRRMVEAPCAAERSDGESLDNVREIIKKTKYFGLSFTIFVKKLKYFNIFFALAIEPNQAM